MTGELTSIWGNRKLGDLVSFTTGKLDSNAAKPNGEYPFFTCSRETFRTDTYSFDCECVLLAGNNAAGIYPLKYFKGKFDAYQRTYVIRSNDNGRLNNRFLFYSLQPKLELLKSLSTGVATKFLTLTILKDLTLPIPPPRLQAKIVAILSAYDDLIQNNLRRIKILEEIAQALYREWFIKFRFPGHQKVKLVNSPLGKIPEGWEVAKLRDFVECRRDTVDPADHLSDRHYLPIDCLPRRSLALLEDKPWQEAQSSLITFECDDILFGAMRPYFHKVVVAPFRGVTRSTCFVFRPHKSNDISYALMTIFHEETVKFANAHSRGSTIPYAVWEGSMAEMPVILPSSSQRQQFDVIVRPIVRFIQSAFFQQRNLRQTRDLLLAKLISGELDVSELDITITEANA
jgi:type I restriction enzyme S subunit